jgi:hypothetical protein
VVVGLGGKGARQIDTLFAQMEFLYSQFSLEYIVYMQITWSTNGMRISMFETMASHPILIRSSLESNLKYESRAVNNFRLSLNNNHVSFDIIYESVKMTQLQHCNTLPACPLHRIIRRSDWLTIELF